jgi:outer membrane protein assembly factor BamA
MRLRKNFKLNAAPAGRRSRLGVFACLLATLFCATATAEDVKPPDISGNQPTPPPEGWLARWLDPKYAPFIPVPEIATDPNGGTTLGLLPVWLKTDDNNEISQIIAPDVLHNRYFGWGAHARIYSYSSTDEQWSVQGGIKERVEREFDAEYQIGRERETPWSIAYSVIYDRSGTPRFYGIGNRTKQGAETSFTNSQELAQVNVGFNVTHAWQILYTSRLQVVDVLPGALQGVPSIGTRFEDVTGLGTNKLFRNRLSLIYDTRNDLTVPTQGFEVIGYSGAASQNGLLNDSMYSEAGADARGYWPVAERTILAAHSAIRYLLSTQNVPFWALPSLGGGDSEVGGAQVLRGFGEGRFYGRNSFASTVELRRTVLTFNSGGTNIDVEVSPFVDVGRVFERSGTFPLGSLHQVYGVGFRGIAKPFVVGHVDIGYGTEGVAVFTGLNYPF